MNIRLQDHSIKLYTLPYKRQGKATKKMENGKQVYKNLTTNASRININNDVYINRDFEKAKS